MPQALDMARVGAYTNELRLMGVERDELPTSVGREGGGRGSLSNKMSRACGSPAMVRMWSGPWGDGANCTPQPVASGGRRWARRCSLLARLAATKRRRSWVGAVYSRLVIETMSNPSLYCSRASLNVQCSEPHWTKKYYTHVGRRPWRMRLGSLRASICRMKAWSPGASLHRRGSWL